MAVGRKDVTPVLGKFSSQNLQGLRVRPYVDSEGAVYL